MSVRTIGNPFGTEAKGQASVFLSGAPLGDVPAGAHFVWAAIDSATGGSSGYMNLLGGGWGQYFRDYNLANFMAVPANMTIVISEVVAPIPAGDLAIEYFSPTTNFVVGGCFFAGGTRAYPNSQLPTQANFPAMAASGSTAQVTSDNRTTWAYLGFSYQNLAQGSTVAAGDATTDGGAAWGTPLSIGTTGGKAGADWRMVMQAKVSAAPHTTQRYKAGLGTGTYGSGVIALSVRYQTAGVML